MMNDPLTKKELKVGEVLRESFGIIWHKPIVLLPMLIVLVFEQLLGIITRFFIVLPEEITSIRDLMPFIPSLLPAMFLTIILVYIIAYPISVGMYPLLVKNILEKKEVDMRTAFGSAVSKAPVLIAAAIILNLITLAGLLFFIIPGIIFIIWYFYTAPVIMFGNGGAIDAMKASKMFAGDKKYKTFLLFLLPFSILIFFDIIVRLITYIITVSLISVYALNDILPLIVTATVVLELISSLFFFSLISVISAYVYIKKVPDEKIL